jgi:hypothetical protein
VSRVVLVVKTSLLLIEGARCGLGVVSVGGVRRGALDGPTARRCATLRLLVGADRPVWGSGGCDLLVEGVGVGLLVLDAVEVLPVDVGECRAVAGVAEEQIEHRPHE